MASSLNNQKSVSRNDNAGGTLPSLSKNYTHDIGARHSRGERQRREIEVRRDEFNASDQKKRRGFDKKDYLDALEQEH